MKYGKYDLLACPHCKAKLELREGFLACTCGRKFPIENGVPVFSQPSESGAKKLFNEETYGREYGKRLERPGKFKLEKAFDIIFKDGKNRIEKTLDIGCDPAITEAIAGRTGGRTIGVNITPEGMGEKGEWAICDVESGIPFVSDSFDLVVCGELIEHVFNADHFMSEIRRVLKTEGYMILATPNLASLWNRLFLLFGYQPHLFGVSEKKSYGNPFLKWDRFRGHIKVFTHKAMKEFLKDNGFEILKVYGTHVRNPHDRIIKKTFRKMSSAFPSLSEDMIFVCKKK